MCLTWFSGARLRWSCLKWSQVFYTRSYVASRYWHHLIIKDLSKWVNFKLICSKYILTLSRSCWANMKTSRSSRRLWRDFDCSHLPTSISTWRNATASNSTPNSTSFASKLTDFCLLDNTKKSYHKNKMFIFHQKMNPTSSSYLFVIQGVLVYFFLLCVFFGGGSVCLYTRLYFQLNKSCFFL